MRIILLNRGKIRSDRTCNIIWKDKNIKSKDDFERALQQKGITISRMTSTGNITYEQGGNKARAKSLGAFNRDDVSSLLERNKSLGQTISRGFSR